MPSNVTGPFEKITFMGATVKNVSVSAGWNDQATNITVLLIEDTYNGDDFILSENNNANSNGALIGTPFSLLIGEANFSGILLGFRKSNSIQGRPTYEVTLGAPNIILDAVQIILSGYVGPINDTVFNGDVNSQTFELSNILNIYGYLEDGGDNFGNARITDTGLLWEGDYGLRNAIESLTVSDGGEGDKNFGSKIKYRGHFYSVNLNNIPVTPSDYRIGGSVNMSLMEIITRVCFDCGVDYIPTLQVNPGSGPHMIGFKTADRSVQPPLGQIAAYISGKTNVSSSEDGQELRTEPTQAMLLGGNVEELYLQDNSSIIDPSIIPFWGYNDLGNPITGQTEAGGFFADDDHQMTLNASAISDLTGALGFGTGYPCSVVEMRCALIDYDSWATFLYVRRNDIAVTLGVRGAGSFDDESTVTPSLVYDFINDEIEVAEALGNMNTTSGNNPWTTVSQRLYEFVRQQAETYYGKKFLVKIPFTVNAKLEPGYSQVIYSDEPSDLGYLSNDSLVLGLEEINRFYFTEEDGRYRPFLKFNSSSAFNAYSGPRTVVVNQASLSDEEVICQPLSQTLFVGCQQGEPAPSVALTAADGSPAILGGNIVLYRNPFGILVPCLVCTVNSPIFAQGEDVLGGVNDLSAILGINVAEAVQYRGTSFPMRIHPPAFYPNAVAIAMKRTQYTYGPWGKFGTHGRVEFEKDDSLTPWEYGDSATMTLAALAKLASINTTAQVLDRGNINEVGLPTKSLADQLTEGGPIISSISIDLSVDGAKTTYSLENYIARFGVFSRENADRIRRLAKQSQHLRRSVQQLFLQNFKQSKALASAYRGYMYGTSYAVQQRTPHAVLIGHAIPSIGISVGNFISPMVYTGTLQESVANVLASSTNPSGYQNTAAMGLEGLLRPVAVYSHSNMAYLRAPDEFEQENVITGLSLDVTASGNDFQWLTSGSTYRKMNTRKVNPDPYTTRFMALRGPIVITGWGYDVAGYPVPNASGAGIHGDGVGNSGSGNFPLWKDQSNSFIDNHMLKSNEWAAGSLDVRWDRHRAVWASPGMTIFGTTSGILPANSSGLILLQDVDEQMIVWNKFSRAVASNKTCAFSYNAYQNRWCVVAADC